MTRVSVRAKSYRGEEGFLVSERAQPGGVRRIFCFTREGASLIKAAWREQARINKEQRETVTRLWEEPLEHELGIPIGLLIGAARRRALEARLEAEAVVSSVLLSGY